MASSAICPDCNKVFTHKKNLYQHQRNIHKTEPELLDYPKNFTCDSCGVSFTFIHNLYRHKKKVHNEKMGSNDKHECGLCDEGFHTQFSYLRHLEIGHNEPSETFLFNSKREFEEWKTDEEVKNEALFTTRSCYKVFNNARKTNFLCHRYGEFKSRNTGRRCLKVQGSTREGHHCTARMEVTEFQNGEVKVIYFPIHKMHQDRVNYGRRKDKDETSLLTLDHIPVRKRKIKLRDIREVHELAESLNPNIIVSRNETNSSVFFVKSETDPVQIYRVSTTGNPCFPGNATKKCNLVCTQCDVCIHKYKCSCQNWAFYGGLMCKHIHLVGLSLNGRGLNLDESPEVWYPKISGPDDSIFVEIELEGENDVTTSKIDSPLDIIETNSSDQSQIEIDLSTFEGITKFGKIAAVSDLDPQVIRKINSTTNECLSHLALLITEESPDNNQITMKKWL